LREGHAWRFLGPAGGPVYWSAEEMRKSTESPADGRPHGSL